MPQASTVLIPYFSDPWSALPSLLIPLSALVIVILLQCSVYELILLARVIFPLPFDHSLLHSLFLFRVFSFAVQFIENSRFS